MYVEEIMGMGPPVFRCDLAMLCLTGLAVERCEVRHEKTDLKVFVVVIPKEGWTRVAAPILLLV